MYPWIPLSRFPIDNQYHKGAESLQPAKLVSEAERESAMRQRVYSRIALRTLLKFRTCAEGWVARERTCWKRRSKTHDRTASDRPPTIQRTLHNAPQGKTIARRDEMPNLTGAPQAPPLGRRPVQEISPRENGPCGSSSKLRKSPGRPCGQERVAIIETRSQRRTIQLRRAALCGPFSYVFILTHDQGTTHGKSSEFVVVPLSHPPAQPGENRTLRMYLSKPPTSKGETI
jgi:hypothetical protein